MPGERVLGTFVQPSAELVLPLSCIAAGKVKVQQPTLP